MKKLALRGSRVMIKHTGDEDIDKYVGQEGVIVQIERATKEAVAMGDRVTHYHVRMSEGKVIVINEDEFDVV